MWLQQQLSQLTPGETPFLGKIVEAAGGKVGISAHIRLADIPCVHPPGLFSMPRVGDDALILPVGGGYLCAAVLPQANSTEGEISLTAPGGASLHLCADGSVVINGVTITKAGEILPAKQQGGQA